MLDQLYHCSIRWAYLPGEDNFGYQFRATLCRRTRKLRSAQVGSVREKSVAKFDLMLYAADSNSAKAICRKLLETSDFIRRQKAATSANLSLMEMDFYAEYFVETTR